MSDLIGALVDGVRGGVVPRPVAGEPIEDFRFRCAHAGALIALSWLTNQQDQGQETAEEVSDVGATVTPLPVSLSERHTAVYATEDQPGPPQSVDDDADQATRRA